MCILFILLFVVKFGSTMGKNKRGMIENWEATKAQTREDVKRLHEGTSSNAHNVTDENIII